MQSILIIQPAFLGDLILSTALVEKLSKHYPNAPIDLLIRKGYQRIIKDHPKIRSLLVFDRKNKWKSLRKLILQIRKNKYDLVINTHRHFSSGLLTAFSGAKQKIGFHKNPWSWSFHKKVKHSWDLHETDRNHLLIAEITDSQPTKPQLYPSTTDQEVKKQFNKPYITISPASLWATKQLPLEVWVNFIKQLPEELDILLMGGPADQEICTVLAQQSQSSKVQVIAGQHFFLEDVVIMQHAKMNYVLDSAPLHICSASNAPVAAIFCSTSPSFGFGPLSDTAFVVETQTSLDCRPCGAHGHKKCPQGHFHCAQITVEQLLNCIS